MPPWPRAALVGALALLALSECSSLPLGTPKPTSIPGVILGTPVPTLAATRPPAPAGLVILVGTIVTMAEPARVEAIAYRDGEVVAVGSRSDVLALDDGSAEVIELGDNVAYPGFIDAHAHWIGDRSVMGIETPEEAMAAALARGWTSISEQWVDPARLQELDRHAAGAGLPLRVDGYLALNLPAPTGEHLGDWYVGQEPGPRADRLRVRGLKVTLDNGWGSQVWWTPEELTRTITHANALGWQVAVHTVSANAHEMVISAFESALEGRANVLHHRIDHAIQVSDDQLARMVAADLTVVVHLDGAAADWVLEPDYLGHLGANKAWLARWQDFVDAGLHVAAATDSPWIFPGFTLTDQLGRAFDQVAGGMDGRGRANPDTPAWVLQQLLTGEQGLRAITVDAAWALGDEALRGHLALGTYADITILSGDLLAATPDEIRAMDVVATIVGGSAAFCRDAGRCPGR